LLTAMLAARKAQHGRGRLLQRAGP
jgi:hypothetical protein